jgi:hypothetical protein
MSQQSQVTHEPFHEPSLDYQIAQISIDPDKQLLPTEQDTFSILHKKYKVVFDSKIGKYNDALGVVRAYINMGSVEPPPQKARIPSYNRENLEQLQDKMDELERNGVLAKPEDVGTVIEHVSPSFLVKKSSGGFRLVTAFNNIGTYTKPSPSRITTSDEILQFLAQWKYVIKSDMTSQFHQLPMKKASMKYLGIVTPFKGTRVYTRAAMGMPGSTEHLDELMFRVLGELIREGVVMKIADDLYVGGDDIPSLLYNWERVLNLFEMTNLRLSPTKTVICPITATVLGWVWSAGTISVSQHKLNPLTTCDRPTTVKGMRSWCGAVKHIKACLPQYSTLLADLEKATAGKESRDRIEWTEPLQKAFSCAQKALLNPKTITIRHRDDRLTITNDGAVRNGGIGSVLYIMRKGKMLLGGYFSAKLKPHQSRWLPCEVEALAISSATNHWGPLILQSRHQTQILTDSRPCIQAYDKLSRGEFSLSARVSTFLSTLTRYNVMLQHIPGSSNLPADFLSRSPMECDQHSCQICKFISESECAAVFNVTVSDVINGRHSMPFTNTASWKKTQQDCPSLRRTYAQLSQGTRPGKKATTIKDVKRYLRVATLGREGLLIVKQTLPFMNTRHLTIVPRHILPGLLTALHLRLEHPSASQLNKVFHRYFYALDVDTEIKSNTAACAQCASLKQLPKEVVNFSTSVPPTSPGSFFACDILCRSRQKIMVIRDSFSSFTTAKLIPNEQSDTLRNAILESTAELKPDNGACIRVDGATAMQSLVTDSILAKHGLTIEVGRLKNKNKNPIADKAIQELEHELKKAYPNGGPVSSSSLALVVATLNTRVRNRGLSAKEILTQRDHITGEQLNLIDADLSEQQHELRSSNHTTSAHSKAPRGKAASMLHVSPGNLVYLKCDGTKHTVRDRYIVMSLDGEFAIIKKLVGSQFRSREYKVKASEMYLVPCAISPHISNEISHSDPYDTYDSDSSLDSVDNAPGFGEDQYQAPAVEIRARSPSPINDVASDIQVVPEDPQGNVLQKRPPRDRRHPKWMYTGDWET